MGSESDLPRQGWDGSRAGYRCADGATVHTRRRDTEEQAASPGYKNLNKNTASKEIFTNGLRCELARKPGDGPEGTDPRGYDALLSGMRMSRDMATIIRNADAKVVVFPRSVRRLEERAFHWAHLLE